MNEVSTADVAYHALREVTCGAGDPVCERPTLPWPLLKARLRQPTIFVVLPRASAGDSGPFVRVLADLAECLPGHYHLLRLASGSTFWDTNTESSQSLRDQITETEDTVEWLHQMRVTPPDAVITNQLFYRDRTGEIDDGCHWERLLHDELFQYPRTRNIPVLLIEFVQHEMNARSGLGDWQAKVEDGEVSLEVYKAWHEHPYIDCSGVEDDRRDYGCRQLPSLLLLECYPAELLTTAEMAYTTGIVCGHVEPLVGPQAQSEALDSFLADCAATNRKIVLLVRGGITANDTMLSPIPVANNILPLEERDTAAELLSIVDYGLAMRLAENVAVIAQGAAGSQAKKVKNNIFNAPRMDLDFAKILPQVDLVIHHGGSGTTIAALKSGCGRFLRPRQRFDEALGAEPASEVVEVATEMLQEDQARSEACLHWQEKFEKCNEIEGVPVAVDTLRRIVAKILLGKPSSGGEISNASG